MDEIVNLADYDYLVHKANSSKYSDVTEERIRRYEGKLPNFLLEIWRRYGLTSHAQGYVWLVYPDDYTEIVTDMFGKDCKMLVFARDSLSNLWAVDGKAIYKIDCQYAIAVRMDSENADINAIFSYGLIVIDSKTYKQHLKAQRKLGAIDQNQMYGYVPILALGGNGSLKQTKVVQSKEYLSLVVHTVIDAKNHGWNPLELITST